MLPEPFDCDYILFLKNQSLMAAALFDMIYIKALIF
jgi:hypothetical protein